MNISVVVPVYNSAVTLDRLVGEITAVMNQVADHHEIILVNDSSRDNSWEQITRICAGNNKVRGIDLMRNYGQHNALLCGIRSAKYEITVTLDDDLQNPASEIPKLLHELRNHDVVYGFPLQQQHGLYRNLGSTLTKWVLKNAMGADTANRISPFRAFRTELRNAFTNYQSPNVTIDVLLTWGTTKFSSVPVRHEPRECGGSNYNLARLASVAFNLITGFSTFPLQLASWMGFACMTFGIFVMFYVLLRYFIEGGSVPGFPFLACMISIFSGVQLFALGIIGEYIARMHGRSIEKPPYIVRKSLACDETQLSNNAGPTMELIDASASATVALQQRAQQAEPLHY